MLPLKGAWVQSLVRELRSDMMCGATKKKRQKNNWTKIFIYPNFCFDFSPLFLCSYDLTFTKHTKKRILGKNKRYLINLLQNCPKLHSSNYYINREEVKILEHCIFTGKNMNICKKNYFYPYLNSIS